MQNSFPLLPQTKRIWLNAETELNTYAEFTADFEATDKAPVFLQLACDSFYAVWLNGSLAAFSACGDYPWYKLYDSVELKILCPGKNELLIAVWYEGKDTQNYLTGNPGLMFELTQKDRVLLCSGKETLSRRMTNYQGGELRFITPQLGMTFCYDNSVRNTLPYSESLEYPAWSCLVQRTAPQMRLLQRQSTTVTECDDGFLIDLGKETAGFLDLDLESSTRQKLLISYSEHLVNGDVPRFIGERDFSVEFICAQGKNTYLNPFRRLAGRYLRITCPQPVILHYAGLRPTELPVSEKPVAFSNPLDRKIYDVCVNTLKKCMHEHYEDCPWREQAMYALDSRNQMLCGYEAFEGTAYQRQMLLLMAQGQRPDGLLPICFPTGIDYPIPFFSMVYLQILEEYIAFTGDTSVLDDTALCVRKLMQGFTSRVEENGLIARLPYPFWNFFEWAEGSDHADEITRKADDPYCKHYDLILNAMYVLTARRYNRLFGQSINLQDTEDAIMCTFYNKEKQLFRLSTEGELYSVLGNSMALLIGLGDETLAKRLFTDKSLIPVTLSMTTFFYDGLLRFGDTFRVDILNDIRTKYGKMLDEGATTFWETENGWHDFDNAGSLCHGWSALPIYYLKKLL